MKRLLIAVGLLALISSCGGNKAGEGVDKDTLDSVVDTIVAVPADKEDSLIAETKVPKAADGVFYDFMSSFCQNSKYQKSRIKFPLPCLAEGRRRMVTAKEWHFSKLHYNSDIYTVFFPNAKSISLETDERVKKVSVLWYNTVANVVSKYKFEKLDDQWMLTLIEEETIDGDAENGFVGFYSKFASDESFRKEHLAETILYDGIDPDEEEEFDAVMVKNKKIHSSEWNDILIPELSGEQFSNIDFGQDLSGPERMVSVESPSSGFSSRLHFHKEADKWRLYKIENF